MKPLPSILTIPFALGLTVIPTLTTHAQPRLSTPSSAAGLVAQAFSPPKRGTPVSTAGGATRGSCTEKGKNLVPLMPKEKLGLTIAERPTLFLYVPPTEVRTAQLTVLGNQDTDVVYEASLPLPKKSGVIQLTLPDQAPALKVGKQYHWFLSIDCKADGTGGEMSVEGWVERIQPTSALTQALKKADAKQQVKLYANNGIWHEAVATLAKLRLEHPKDAQVQTNWKELLRSVGLSAIATEPLVGDSQITRR
jgi:hypothetical protein